ncbi:MAG TPA: hypothetical protein VL180_02355, partial [Burkholderiales bacterium]|nr:hypothetical protein [Burkholderiales bacterium]
MSRGALYAFLSAALVAACASAFAQKNPGGAKDSDIPVLTISTAKDPVDKSYRRMVRGIELFEQ